MFDFLKKKKLWTVILVGERTISDQEFNDDDFKHPERLYWRAEQLEDTPDGTINDVYYLYHLNRIKKIALYFKHKI